MLIKTYVVKWPNIIYISKGEMHYISFYSYSWETLDIYCLTRKLEYNDRYMCRYVPISMQVDSLC